MKRKGFAPLIIIGIIAVILIVGVAGYFVWKAYVTPNPADLCSPNDSVYTLDGQFVRCATPQTPPCCKTMVIPTSTPSQDTTTTNTATVAQPPSAANTSGWQTYANQQYGFSFEYPSGWVVTSSVLGPSTNGITLDSSTTDATITFDQNPNNLSAQEYYNGQNEPSLFGDQNAYESTTTVGGLLAYASTPYASEAGESYLIVPRDGYFIDVMVLTSDPVFDQIISTFQFTQ